MLKFLLIKNNKCLHNKLESMHRRPNEPNDANSQQNYSTSCSICDFLVNSIVLPLKILTFKNF